MLDIMQRSHPRNPYLIPFIIAIALHLVLLIVMMSHWPDEAPRQVGLNSNVQVISAVAISSAKVSTQTPPKPIEKPVTKPVEPPVQKTVESKPAPEKKAATPPPSAKPKPEPVKLKPSAAQLKATAAAKALKQKQEKLKQQKLNAEKAKQLQKKLLAQQLAAEQKKLKAQQQKEATQAKALQQKILQQQLASEQRNLQKAAEEQRQAMQLQGALDEYKSQIIAAISQYWIVPPETQANIYCRLLIHLAPTGMVLKVDMLHSSGDPVLDRSAREAVLKASPLPVPKEARLFDSFRELRLSFRPEGVVQG